jgi:sigma-B regulation protein RsbU (phosphoserine phosphatase)
MVDFFHMLSYKGMPAFLINNPESNRATTFWIIARLLSAFYFILAVYMNLEKRSKINKKFFALTAFFISIIILIVVTYYPDFLPPMYIEGKGLTPLKIVLEYLIILLLAVSGTKSLIMYIKTGDKLSALMCGSLILGIFSELAFVSYDQVYDIYNYIGHIYKVIAYSMLFVLAFVRNVQQPYIELYEAERKLRNYADSLDKTVEQRTKQLKNVNKRLMDDLKYAKGIQKAMLPAALPDMPEFSFNAMYYPAERLSGDFYDIFKLDDQHFAFYICDVSGHGVPAAMLTVFLKQCIDNKKDMDLNSGDISFPSKVLLSVFDSFNNTNFKDEVYMVLAYAIYNIKTKKLIYSSAGLNAVPILIKENGEIEEIPIRGFPICKLKNEFNVNYDDSYLDLSKGDKLLFYTDGLVDAKNMENRQYGIDRLNGFLLNNSGLSGEELRNSLKQDLYDYINGKKISDDITFFILEIA